MALVSDGSLVDFIDDMLPGGREFLVMLKVYLDRGYKEDGTDAVVAVAAVVFRPVAYKQFVRPWNRLLRGWTASAFHSTDFYPGAQEFKRGTQAKKDRFDRDSKIVPRLIRENTKYILVVAARPQEFLKEAPDSWKNTFGTNIHAIGIQTLLITMGWWAEDNCYNEKFAYFRESGDKDDGEVARSVEAMRTGHPDTARLIRISSFAHVQKGIERGTEAADCVAWHWNKWYMDKARRGKEQEPRKDFAELVGSQKDKFGYIFLTGDRLKFFFTLKPRERSEIVI